MFFPLLSSTKAPTPTCEVGRAGGWKGEIRRERRRQKEGVSRKWARREGEKAEGGKEGRGKEGRSSYLEHEEGGEREGGMVVG